MTRPKRIVALVAGLLLVILSSGAQAADASQPGASHVSVRTSHPIAVSGLSANGHLRCTATFPSSLDPGRNTGMQVFGEEPHGAQDPLR